jgi:hypothetical protein
MVGWGRRGRESDGGGGAMVIPSPVGYYLQIIKVAESYTRSGYYVPSR